MSGVSATNLPSAASPAMLEAIRTPIEGHRTCGWERRFDGWSGGTACSDETIGHTGFTGGSVWIDHERRRIYALLAHRLRSLVDFNPSRREFHRLAAAVGG